MGGKRSQARAKSPVNPMVLDELASSALTTRPCREIQAMPIGLSEEERGRVGLTKVVERRQRAEGENGRGRDTRDGGGDG